MSVYSYWINFNLFFRFFSESNRLQNANSNELVSMKAHIKVLEMKLKSLQCQVDQKNRENEELSHIVNELIQNKQWSLMFDRVDIYNFEKTMKFHLRSYFHWIVHAMWYKNISSFHDRPISCLIC